MTYFDEFGKKWADQGSIEPISDTQRAVGWDFLGSVPPISGQFNRVQQNTDEKINYLFNLINSFLLSRGVSLGPTTTNALRDTLNSILNAIASGAKAYGSLEELLAVENPTKDSFAWVLNDPDASKNGMYRFDGSEWIKADSSIEVIAQEIYNNIYQYIFENSPKQGLWPYVHSEVDANKKLMFGINAETGCVELALGKVWARPSLHDTLETFFTNSRGEVTHGFKYDGSMAFKLDMEVFGSPLGRPLLDDVFVYARVDKNRKVIYGEKWDGSTTGSGQTPEGAEANTWIGDKQEVIVFTKEQHVIEAAFENFGPRVETDKLTWIQKTPSGTYKRHRALPISLLPTSAGNITHVIGYGESLAAGTSTDGPILTIPLNPTKVFMLNAGVLALGREQNAGAQFDVISDDGIQYIIPAYSQIKESPVLSSAYEYAKLHPSETIAVSQHGYGGAVIAGLVRGNIAYSNLVHTASMLRGLATANGKTYKIAPIMFVQGTNDFATPLATYSAAMLQLWTELNEDLKKVTGQVDDIKIVVEQTLSGGGANDGSLAFAQIETWQANQEKFIMANPRYGWDYVDSAHLRNYSYVNLGGIQGIAGGSPSYLPLYPISAALSGATVTLTFSEGDLLLDTTTILPFEDGNYGFFWKDSTSSATITNVSLSGNQVTLTLSGAPTGADQQVRIADRMSVGGSNIAGTGKRCNLRSASALGNDSLGNPMYKRAAIYRINVT
jgi:hypothetical protein